MCIRDSTKIAAGIVGSAPLLMGKKVEKVRRPKLSHAGSQTPGIKEK